MEPIITDVVLTQLAGELTQPYLHVVLTQAKADITPNCGMLVDCTAMTAYDGAARTYFVEWHRAHRERFRGVAIVTTKQLWHLVISAMAVASGQRMRAFHDRATAEAWIREGCPR